MVDVAGFTLSVEEQEFLQHPAVGAVILFSRNFSSVQQVSELVTHIKSLRNPALLVAVDQEGGRVQRFRQGFTNLPPLLRLGQAYDCEPSRWHNMAYNTGRLMAAELRQIDVDFSFAPVLDVANLHSKIIGDRAFHQDPEIVGTIATSYINGMNSAGMEATGKHFPGHGGVLADSHLETPVDSRDLDNLLKTDLLPYFELGSRLGAVMTAHISFPSVDNQLPTFSAFWIGHVLRKTVGFNGLVFSDDLSMQGAQVAGDPQQRVNSALAAGCDMVLICNDPDVAREAAENLGSNYLPDQQRLQKMAGAVINVSSDEIVRLSEEVASLMASA